MASKHALRMKKDGPHVLQCWAFWSGFVLGWDSPEAVEIGRPVDTLNNLLDVSCLLLRVEC